MLAQFGYLDVLPAARTDDAGGELGRRRERLLRSAGRARSLQGAHLPLLAQATPTEDERGDAKARHADEVPAGNRNREQRAGEKRGEDRGGTPEPP